VTGVVELLYVDGVIFFHLFDKLRSFTCKLTKIWAFFLKTCFDIFSKKVFG